MFLKALSNILQHPNNHGHLVRAIFVTLWWKVNQLFFHFPTLVEIAPGIKILCDPASSYGSFIVYTKWPEFEELDFIFSTLQSNSTYVDIGAHIGDSSLLAATKIKAGKIIACEPTPNVYDELKNNIKLNNLERKIRALQMAVSNKTGSSFFDIENTSETNHLTNTKTKTSIEVPTITIDDLIKKESVSKISLLKIDVEGFEWEVIQGCKKSFGEKRIETILFEVNPSVKMISSKLEKLEKMLKRYDFSFYFFTSPKNLEPTKRLFVPQKTSNFIAVLPSVSLTGMKINHE